MNDDLERDELDADVGRRMRSLGNGPDDALSVLHAMGPRFIAAQRRRRAAMATSAAAAVMSLVGIAAALSGGGGARVDTIPPAASSSSLGAPLVTDRDGSLVTSTSTNGSGGTDSTTGDATSNSSGSPGVSTDTTSGSGAGPNSTGGGNAPTTRPSSPGTTTSTTPSSSGSTTTSAAPTTTGPSGTTKTCTDPVGNRITVQWNGATISLVSAVAASGWNRNFDDDFDPDEIRIEFESGSSGYRIRGRWNNGAIECSWSAFVP